MEIRIEDFLREYNGKEILYLPNPGNSGDALIAAGTFQAFERAGIRHRSLPDWKIPQADDILFYGGGGNLVAEQTYSHRVLSRLHRHVKTLVILPHTIKDVDRLLGEFGANVVVFCRERDSYRYVTKAAPKAKVMLAHDMALQCDPGSIRHANDLRVRVRAASALLRSAVRGEGRASLRVLPGLLFGTAMRSLMAVVPQGNTLHVMRTDEGPTGVALSPTNTDISAWFDMWCAPREVADYVAGVMLAVLDRFETVVTNRLHVAIGAALLGKTVHMHANNFFKNRAVYEYSLRDRFPNVVWVEDDLARTTTGPIAPSSSPQTMP